MSNIKDIKETLLNCMECMELDNIECNILDLIVEDNLGMKECECENCLNWYIDCKENFIYINKYYVRRMGKDMNHKEKICVFCFVESIKYYNKNWTVLISYTYNISGYLNVYLSKKKIIICRSVVCNSCEMIRNKEDMVNWLICPVCDSNICNYCLENNWSYCEKEIGECSKCENYNLDMYEYKDVKGIIDLIDKGEYNDFSDNDSDSEEEEEHKEKMDLVKYKNGLVMRIEQLDKEILIWNKDVKVEYVREGDNWKYLKNKIIKKFNIKKKRNIDWNKVWDIKRNRKYYDN